MKPSNPYEETNRQKKATALFHQLVAHGIDTETLTKWASREDFWKSLADHAHVTHPSDETRKLVRQMLEDQEAAIRNAQ
jgi:hypothetical protein